MLDLRQLQALSALASEGSVARAAKRLGWSQPTVDHHLRNLDRLVGCELTTRTTRGTSLTETGDVLLESGETILRLAERALKDARTLAKEGTVRLRLGIFPTAAAWLLPGIAAAAQGSGIDLDTTLEELPPLIAGVNRGTLDAALLYAAGGYTLPLAGDVHTTELFTERLLLALPEGHPASAHDNFTKAGLLELADEHWVMGSSEGDTIDTMVQEVFAQNGHELDVRVRTDDYSAVLGLIGAGMGVAVVPQLATRGGRAGVALRKIANPRFSRRVLLAAPAASSGPGTGVARLAAAIRHAIYTHRSEKTAKPTS